MLCLSSLSQAEMHPCPDSFTRLWLTRLASFFFHIRVEELKPRTRTMCSLRPLLQRSGHFGGYTFMFLRAFDFANRYAGWIWIHNTPHKFYNLEIFVTSLLPPAVIIKFLRPPPPSPVYMDSTCNSIILKFLQLHPPSEGVPVPSDLCDPFRRNVSDPISSRLLGPLSPIYYNLEISDWYFWDTTYLDNDFEVFETPRPSPCT